MKVKDLNAFYHSLYLEHLDKKSIKELSKLHGIPEKNIRYNFNKLNLKEQFLCRYCGTDQNLKIKKFRGKYITLNICELCFPKIYEREALYTYNELYELHIIEKKSILEISKHFNTTDIRIKTQFKRVGLKEIPRCNNCGTEDNLMIYKAKTNKEKVMNLCYACKHIICSNIYNNLDEAGKAHKKETAEKTCIERYGVSNIFKDKEFIKNKTIEKLGVSNVFKSEQFKERAKETKLLKYGNENYNNRIKSKKTCLKNNGVEYGFLGQGKGYSKISQKLFWDIYNKLPKALQEYTYFGELNKEYHLYDKENKVHYFYDFVITNIKYCIEFNGTAFHYHPTQWKGHAYGTEAEYVIQHDLNKFNCICGKNFIFNNVWEHEYNKNGKYITNSIITIINVLYKGISC